MEKREGSAKEKVKDLFPVGRLQQRVEGHSVELEQFYRVNCIGVWRAKSRPTGFHRPAAEITFSDRTWRCKRNAVQSQRKREQKGEGQELLAQWNSSKQRDADRNIYIYIYIYRGHPRSSPVPRMVPGRKEKRGSRSIFGYIRIVATFILETSEYSNACSTLWQIFLVIFKLTPTIRRSPPTIRFLRCLFVR